MTRTLAILTIALLSATLQGQEKKELFEIHEWGTFTSMQGANGLGLEGLQHEEERLPDFVYSRTEVRECPLRKQGYKGLEVPVTHVTQKMETPVIYFHSRTKRQVRLRVDFKEGLLTQWYPVTDLLGPPESAFGKGPLDLSTVKSSFLEWDIDVIPANSPQPPQLPHVMADDIWSLARKVDACYIKTRPRIGPNRLGPVEAERFLFYRGLGTFKLPFSISARKDGFSVFENRGDFPVDFAVAVEVRGGNGRMVICRGVEKGGEFKISLAKQKMGTLDRLVPVLEKVLMDAVMSRGMTVKEARAMVKTWARSWFRTEGNRVLYLVPRQTIDQILPLQISPKPDKLERVLVGRLEYITSAREQLARTALLNYNSESHLLKEDARKYLTSLDRFLEPHVRLVMAHAKNHRTIQMNGAQILALLKQRI